MKRPRRHGLRGPRHTTGITVFEAVLAVIIISVIAAMSLPYRVAERRAAAAERTAERVQHLAAAVVAYRSDQHYLNTAYGTWPTAWSDLDGRGGTPAYVGTLPQVTSTFEVLDPLCRGGDSAPCDIRLRMLRRQDPEGDAQRVAARLAPRARVDPVDRDQVIFLVGVPEAESDHDDYVLLDGTRPFKGAVTFGAGACAASTDCMVVAPDVGEVILEASLVAEDARFDTLDAATLSITDPAGSLDAGGANITNLHAREFAYGP